jgi:hypothetical protein
VLVIVMKMVVNVKKKFLVIRIPLFLQGRWLVLNIPDLSTSYEFSFSLVLRTAPRIPSLLQLVLPFNIVKIDG